MSGSLLTKEQILSQRCKQKDVELKAWGGTVKLRELSTDQLLGLNDIEDLTDRNMTMLSLMILNGDGAPMFSQEELIQAAKHLGSSGVLEAIGEANKINGITEAAADSVSKKSATAPNTGSDSGLPAS